MTKTITYSQSLLLIYSYKWNDENKYLSSVHIIGFIVLMTKTIIYPQSLSLIYSYKWRKQVPTLSPDLWFVRTNDENKYLPSVLIIVFSCIRDESKYLFSVLITDFQVQLTKTSTYPQSLSLNYSYMWRNKYLPSVLIVDLLVLMTKRSTLPQSFSLIYMYSYKWGNKYLPSVLIIVLLAFLISLLLIYS